MITEVSVKCEVFKHKLQSAYLVKIRTLEGYLWEGVFEKEKVFDMMGVVNESVPIKGRVHASLITHNSVYASVELPVDNSKNGKRVNIPLNFIWPPPTSG
jgi:hypothetical protein